MAGSATWFTTMRRATREPADFARSAGRWGADPAPNCSFVLPGGKIFVFTGILPITQNEDGLAVVMGHGALLLSSPRTCKCRPWTAEIAHQVARHSAERMSYGKVRTTAFLMRKSTAEP